jgi:hypothetical protein
MQSRRAKRGMPRENPTAMSMELVDSIDWDVQQCVCRISVKKLGWDDTHSIWRRSCCESGWRSAHLAWNETGIRSFVIRWICPAPPCAYCSADTFCCCYSGCVCCCCCYGSENRKREDDMVVDPNAAFSLSLPPPRPTPKHFRLLPPTQQTEILSTTPTSHAKTLPSSPSHATIQNPQEPLLACLNKKTFSNLLD